jgi:hypothetical protein
MNDLDEVVTSPGFVVVVAACWTVLVGVICWLFAWNDGFGAGLAEGRRRYLKDAQGELLRRRAANAASIEAERQRARRRGL